MNETRPFFIVSAGDLEHIYYINYFQVPDRNARAYVHTYTTTSLKYHLGFISEADLIRIKKLFGSSAYYSRKFWEIHQISCRGLFQ